MLSTVLDVALPDAGFYLWAGVTHLGVDDIAFAQGLLGQYNVAVLPGSLLAREAGGANPGAGRIRLDRCPQPDPPPPLTVYGATFDHVAPPSRPIVGVVRDAKFAGFQLSGVARSNVGLGVERFANRS